MLSDVLTIDKLAAGSIFGNSEWNNCHTNIKYDPIAIPMSYVSWFIIGCDNHHTSNASRTLVAINLLITQM